MTRQLGVVRGRLETRETGLELGVLRVKFDSLLLGGEGIGGPAIQEESLGQRVEEGRIRSWRRRYGTAGENKSLRGITEFDVVGGSVDPCRLFSAVGKSG